MTKPTGKQVWEWAAGEAATRPQMTAAMARSIKIQTDIAATGRSADLDAVRARIEAKIEAARQRLAAA